MQGNKKSTNIKVDYSHEVTYLIRQDLNSIYDFMNVSLAQNLCNYLHFTTDGYL